MGGRGKRGWLIAAAVLLALIAAGLARLHTLVSIAGDRWPAERRPGSLTAEIDELRGKLAAVALSGRDRQLAERLLPRDADTEAVLRALRQTAAATGAEVRNIAVQQVDGTIDGWRAVDGGPVVALAVTVGLAGSYDALALFVNAVEGGHPDRIGRLFAVDGLHFLSGQDGRHLAEIDLRAFAMPGTDGNGVPPGRSVEAIDLAAVFRSQAFSYPAGGDDPMTPPERPERSGRLEQLEQAKPPEQGEQPLQLTQPGQPELPGQSEQPKQPTQSEQPEQVERLETPDTPAPVAVTGTAAEAEPEAIDAEVDPVQVGEPAAASPDTLGDRLAEALEAMLSAMAEGDLDLVERLAGRALGGLDADAAASVSERARRISGGIAQLRQVAAKEREREAATAAAAAIAAAVAAAVVEPEPEPISIRVDGIAWSEDDPRVIVDGAVLGIGDYLPAPPGAAAAKILAITPHEAVFLHQGKRITRQVDLFRKSDW